MGFSMPLPGLSPLRLLGGLFGLIALGSTAWLIADRFTQKARADAAVSCDRLVAGIGLDFTPCLPAVQAAALTARRSNACAAALLPRLSDENRFAMQQSCGAGVKRLVAERDAAEAGQADAEARLADVRAGTERAVARAEIRATAQQERDKHVQDVLAGAPRRSDGGVDCDAGCLQRLSQ